MVRDANNPSCLTASLSEHSHEVISRALQAGGFGRSAMAQLERLAAAPPYDASVVALDTIRRDYHLSEEHLRWLYDRRGLERPKRHVSTQDWYASQGYEQIPNSAVSFYENKDEDGSVHRLPVIFLSKKLLPAMA